MSTTRFTSTKIVARISVPLWITRKSLSTAASNSHDPTPPQAKIVSVIGLQTGLLLGGAVLTETIFAWGGVGSWLFEAAVDKDFLVIQSGTLILATIFVLVNLVVDISYAYLNPRIRYS